MLNIIPTLTCTWAKFENKHVQTAKHKVKKLGEVKEKQRQNLQDAIQ